MVGGGSDGGKGRECSQNTKQALLYCLLCFLSCYLTYSEFQITFKGQLLRFLCLEVAAKLLFF